jgi:FMN phosphatase YigB (HAD superfamily)
MELFATVTRDGTEEAAMAKQRKTDKARQSKSATPRPKPRHAKSRTQRPEPVDDDLALAEELLRVSREEQADLVAGFKKFLKQLGIRGKPIGAKKLREMLIKKGFDPEGNEFSQGIIAMREE